LVPSTHTFVIPLRNVLPGAFVATSTGVALLVPIPALPSCPTLLLPQHHTVPSLARIAHPRPEPVLETLVLMYDEKLAATKGVVPPVSNSSLGGDPPIQSVPSLRWTVLPLHATSQEQLDPAHCRAPLQAGPDGQQGWFAPPHAHVKPPDPLLMHCSPEPHVVPLQQDWPAPPQPHVPLVHVRFVPQPVPLQQ
jgi:hypothetical protein